MYHANRAIGRITETLGDDLGLVDCPFDFSNELLDIDVTAQVLKKGEEFSAGVFFFLWILHSQGNSDSKCSESGPVKGGQR